MRHTVPIVSIWEERFADPGLATPTFHLAFFVLDHVRNEMETVKASHDGILPPAVHIQVASRMERVFADLAPQWEQRAGSVDLIPMARSVQMFLHREFAQVFPANHDL